MSVDAFSITILAQGWLEGCSPEDDLCSHGRIRLIIGGEPISAGEMEYGISESALALLRTLGADHSPERPAAERLIFHGCGAILMMGCPIGIDWDVSHAPGSIMLSNVRRYDSTDPRPVRFPMAQATIAEEEYRKAVLGFATEAKSLFVNQPKRIQDRFDQEQYRAFWAEYDGLLDRFGGAATPG